MVKAKTNKNTKKQNKTKTKETREQPHKRTQK